MDPALKDKEVIVGGGAKGIDKGIVKQLASEGAIPVIIGRNESDNIRTVKVVESPGGKAFPVVAELFEPAACAAAIKSVVEMFGRLDELFNKAGVNENVGLESGGYEKFMLPLHKNLVH